jgi:peptide chain release factor subunit 1
MDLLFFQGIVFDVGGNAKFINIFIEPPKPIKINNYLCDKKFDIDPILDLYRTNIPYYGMVIIGGTESWFYKISIGKMIDSKLLESIEVLRDKRQKKGGQSAYRFQMNRLGQMRDYTKKICEKINKYYLETEKIVIIGNGDMKTTIKDNEHLIPSVNNKIIGVISTPTLELTDILPIAVKYIKSISDENKIMKDFLEIMEKESGRVSFGYNEIVKYLNEGLLEKIIINEDSKYLEEIENIKKELNSKCEIIKINDDQLNSKYGSMVGILWYVNIYTDIYENEEINIEESKNKMEDIEFIL